jgi:hypothetical protein
MPRPLWPVDTRVVWCSWGAPIVPTINRQRLEVPARKEGKIEAASDGSICLRHVRVRVRPLETVREREEKGPARTIVFPARYIYIIKERRNKRPRPQPPFDSDPAARGRQTRQKQLERIIVGAHHTQGSNSSSIGPAYVLHVPKSIQLLRQEQR